MTTGKLLNVILLVMLIWATLAIVYNVLLWVARFGRWLERRINGPMPGEDPPGDDHT